MAFGRMLILNNLNRRCFFFHLFHVRQECQFFISYPAQIGVNLIQYTIEYKLYRLHTLRASLSPKYLALKLIYRDLPQVRSVPSFTIYFSAVNSLRGSFPFAASKWWTELPPSVKNAKTLCIFRNLCRGLLSVQKSSENWPLVEASNTKVVFLKFYNAQSVTRTALIYLFIQFSIYSARYL